MSILLVDDSQDNIHPLKLLLETTGYSELLTARSASEAFEQLGMEDPQSAGRGVEVILMDIKMPGLDGIEACRRIKEDRRLRDIPIIMVTGQTEETDLEAAFAAGANDYITKPIKVVELLARLRSSLNLKREMDTRKYREQELLRVTHELEEVNQELHRLSSLDGLTGLANRRHFDNLYERSWRQALRKGNPLSVLMIDIDFFKAYNDTYGHQTGDECLKKVASALSRGLRRSGDVVARYGGEEFIVLLPDTATPGAVVVAEGLRERVKALAIPHVRSPNGRQVTLSLGVASTVPTLKALPLALIAAADHALYQVKQNGRDALKVAEPTSPSPDGPFSWKEPIANHPN
ncbi:MAG: diguanylate cyclase [Planctomycetes bacterium]|nr:diguanylate cyclase [Planctomycetota bacterium]